MKDRLNDFLDRFKPDRSLEFDFAGGYKKMKIRSDTKEGGGDRFDFVFAVTGFPNLRLSYFNSSDDSKEKSTFRIGILRIAEVTDDMDAFTTDSFVRLAGAPNTWSPIERTDSDIENGTLYNFSTTRTWTDGMSVTWDTLVSTVEADGSTYRGKASLDPSSAKFSLAVHNFPYIYNESKLAVVGKLFARGVNTAVSLSDDGYVMEDGSVLLWETSVTADGSEVPLVSGGLNSESLTEEGEDEDDGMVEGEGHRLIVWTVDANQPTHVYWDPTLTQDSELYISDEAGSALFSSAVLLACTLAATVL